MDIAIPSVFQLFVIPIIIPLLPPAAVMFITDSDTPAIEKNVEEFTATETTETSGKTDPKGESES